MIYVLMMQGMYEVEVTIREKEVIRYMIDFNRTYPCVLQFKYEN